MGSDNQRGAALIVILVLVVILSIVGSTMLATTTYGLKNVTKNEKEQKEFYRAEGAIEIALAEINKNANVAGTWPNNLIKSTTQTTYTGQYTIGSEVVQVDVSKGTKTTNAMGEVIPFTMVAKYKNGSKIKRQLTLNVNKTATQMFTKEPYTFVDDSDLKDKGQISVAMSRINLQTYLDILRDYSVDWSQFASKPSVYSDFTFPTGVSYYQNLSLSGKENVTIPDNAVVFVKNVELSGNGNITIKGTLIAETLHNKGNSVMDIKTGIITRYIKGTSASFSVGGTATGIDCADLKTTVCPRLAADGATEATNYTNQIDSNTLKFSTTR